MTVKLAILKSGENLITDIKEGFYEDKLACYLLENPCTIELNGSYRIIGEEDNNKVSISLKPWPIFSKQTIVEIPPNWIVTIVEPKDEIKKMYEEEVLGDQKNETNQDISIIEQSDSDQSN